MHQPQIEEIVRAYYVNFFDANWDEVLSLLSHDIRHEFNEAEAMIGVENFSQFIKIKHTHYREKQKNLEIIVEPSSSKATARFLLEGNYITTYPGLPEAKAQPYSIQVDATIEIEGNKISRIATRFDFDQWLNQILNFERS